MDYHTNLEETPVQDYQPGYSDDDDDIGMPDFGDAMQPDFGEAEEVLTQKARRQSAIPDILGEMRPIAVPDEGRDDDDEQGDGEFGLATSTGILSSFDVSANKNWIGPEYWRPSRSIGLSCRYFPSNVRLQPSKRKQKRLRMLLQRQRRRRSVPSLQRLLTLTLHHRISVLFWRAERRQSIYPRAATANRATFCRKRITISRRIKLPVSLQDLNSRLLGESETELPARSDPFESLSATMPRRTSLQSWMILASISIPMPSSGPRDRMISQCFMKLERV